LGTGQITNHDDVANIYEEEVGEGVIEISSDDDTVVQEGDLEREEVTMEESQPDLFAEEKKALDNPPAWAVRNKKRKRRKATPHIFGSPKRPRKGSPTPKS